MTFEYVVGGDDDDEEVPAPPPPPPPTTSIDPRLKERWDYLMEVLGDYETFLGNIGSLGYSAPQLLYYRDEVQEFMDELQGRPELNMLGAFKKLTELDTILRARAQALVDEIGHKNFLQYQIQNDPPRSHWWWWLNRITAPPIAPPKFWEFWKYQNPTPPVAKAPPPAPEDERDPEVAKLFGKGPPDAG